MADDTRRIAADVRNLLRNPPSDPEEQAAEVRRLLRRQYERGLEAGRDGVWEQVGSQSPRTIILEATAAMIVASARCLKQYGVGDRQALAACHESASILKDAAACPPPQRELDG